MEDSQRRPIRDELRAGLQGAAVGPYSVAMRIALVGLSDTVALASAAYIAIGKPGNGGISRRRALISPSSPPVQSRSCSSLLRHTRTSGISRRSPL